MSKSASLYLPTSNSHFSFIGHKVGPGGLHPKKRPENLLLHDQANVAGAGRIYSGHSTKDFNRPCQGI